MHIIDGTATPSPDLRVAIVVARYNDFVTDRLERGTVNGLISAGIVADRIAIIRVPGAFEIPTVARQTALSGGFEAIVCLGCLIKGETPHFDFIAAAVAQGLIAGAAETGVPMTFGVLTTNSAEEALARAAGDSTNKGWEAARAAVEMATIASQLRQRPTAAPAR